MWCNGNILLCQSKKSGFDSCHSRCQWGRGATSAQYHHRYMTPGSTPDHLHAHLYGSTSIIFSLLARKRAEIDDLNYSSIKTGNRLSLMTPEALSQFLTQLVKHR